MNWYIEKLKQQYERDFNKILEGYQEEKLLSFRVNTLKSSRKKIEDLLDQEQIPYTHPNWFQDAFLVNSTYDSKIRSLDCYQKGEIYVQSLSSMLPALLLEPKEGEHILDMAAAPGSKTTLLAALSNNKITITAVEKNKIRSDRLQFNLKKQGVTCATVLNQSAQSLDEFFSFEKILLDAPCSGSGTLTLKDHQNFSEDLVKHSIKTQQELLKKAVSLLKKDGEMIYSTCSILKEENEDIISTVLNQFEIIPISNENIPTLKSSIPGTITICPSKYYEGFFLAKLRKK